MLPDEADSDLADDLAATAKQSHSLWDTFMGR
jgi:hypothetical protein